MSQHNSRASYPLLPYDNTTPLTKAISVFQHAGTSHGKISSHAVSCYIFPQIKPDKYLHKPAIMLKYKKEK